MGLLISITFIPNYSEKEGRKKGKKIGWWILRGTTAIGSILLMIMMIRNFYTGDPANMCSWCRYLSCWPTTA